MRRPGLGAGRFDADQSIAQRAWKTGFIGAGVNYTRFFGTRTTGPIAGTRLSLSDSWGLAGHVGVDVRVGEKGAIRIDYRKLDIDTKVKLNGANLGAPNTVHIDPSVYGVAYVFSF